MFYKKRTTGSIFLIPPLTNWGIYRRWSIYNKQRRNCCSPQLCCCCCCLRHPCPPQKVVRSIALIDWSKQPSQVVKCRLWPNPAGQGSNSCILSATLCPHSESSERTLLTRGNNSPPKNYTLTNISTAQTFQFNQHNSLRVSNGRGEQSWIDTWPKSSLSQLDSIIVL